MGSVLEKFSLTILIFLTPPGTFFPLQAHTWSVFTVYGFVSVLHINPFHYLNLTDIGHKQKQAHIRSMDTVHGHHDFKF